MLLENEPNYQGVKNRIKRLEENTREYCSANGLPFAGFLGGRLFSRWDAEVCTKRNRAVHAGVKSFTFQETSEAIGIAKETIAFLDGRIPTLSDRVRVDPSMSGIRDSSAGIIF
jgi:hypothetical protein